MNIRVANDLFQDSVLSRPARVLNNGTPRIIARLSGQRSRIELWLFFRIAFRTRSCVQVALAFFQLLRDHARPSRNFILL